LIKIISCGDRFDELVQLVAPLNSDAKHHIGFFREGEADIRASLVSVLSHRPRDFGWFTMVTSLLVSSAWTKFEKFGETFSWRNHDQKTNLYSSFLLVSKIV